MGNTKEAIKLSEGLPSLFGFNKEAALARICTTKKKYAQAAEYYAANIAQHQYQLMHSLILCGNMCAQDGNKKRAATLYSAQWLSATDF